MGVDAAPLKRSTDHFGLVLLEDEDSILHVDDVGLGVHEAHTDRLKLTFLHHRPAGNKNVLVRRLNKKWQL